jgi:Protein of unknown function (DUF3108)
MVFVFYQPNMTRMKFLFRLTLVSLIILSTSAFSLKQQEVFQFREIANQAFTYGEKLNYRVHYGILNAAKISINVDDTAVIINDRSTYHITAKGRTFKSFDWMFKVRDHFESYVDSISIAPLKYFKSVKEDKYSDVDLVFYDHEKKYLKGKKKDMEMPVYIQDIVSASFYARSIDYSDAFVGKTYPLDVYLDQKIYNLKVKYLGKQTIKTDVGKVKCIKLRPQLVVDRVFKDEDDMTIWITDDKNHLPVRIKTALFVGALKVDLNSYSGLSNPFDSKVK